jgi:hypothetical protein
MIFAEGPKPAEGRRGDTRLLGATLVLPKLEAQSSSG